MKTTATIRHYVILILVIALTILDSLAIPGQVAEANDIPNVLIDLSHEFTFMYDGWLPYGYLEPLGYKVTRSWATLTVDLLDSVDVLVIEQVTTAIPFTFEQIAAVQSFVENGGGLLLVGKKWAWYTSEFFPDVTTYPMNDVAAAFGFTFANGYGATPLHPQPHEITQGVNSFDNLGATPGLVTVDAESMVILTDDNGQAVFAVKEFGTGRVAISAEEWLVSNPFTGEPLVNEAFIRQLFDWLSHGRVTRYPGQTLPYRYYPENQLVEGTVTLYYTDALGLRATFLTDNYPIIYNHLVSMMAIEPIYDFTIVALPTGGGGYSGGQEVGVGVLTDDSAVVRVLAHELTHSFVLPGALPGFGFNEGWASLAAIRVARQMGYEVDANAERQYFETQFRTIDPDGTLLDLNTVTVTEHGMAYMGKAMWVIETLEGGYGADFMARLMPLHHQWVQSGQASNPVTMGEFIAMMSEVASTASRPFFQSIGTYWQEVPSYRVLFDEAHSEWTSIASDYRAFADDLRLRGHTVESHTGGPLTADLLANFDVLVVGTAWGDFTDAELDSIQQFVISGGGLFITGLGWSWVNPDLGRTLDNYPMNRIATRFGLRFLDDAICDPTNHYLSANVCTPIFSSMAIHPIASVLMIVGGPITPCPIERLSGTPQAIIFGDEDSYSNKGYYPVSTNPPVVMAVEYGAGRVVALGHERYLSTDDYDGDGNPNRDDYDNAQLGRNIIAWLAEAANRVYLPLIMRNH